MVLADVCRLTVLSDARSCLCRASTSASNRTLTFVDLTATGVTVKQFLILTNSPFKRYIIIYFYKATLAVRLDGNVARVHQFGRDSNISTTLDLVCHEIWDRSVPLKTNSQNLGDPLSFILSPAIGSHF